MSEKALLNSVAKGLFFSFVFLRSRSGDKCYHSSVSCISENKIVSYLIVRISLVYKISKLQVRHLTSPSTLYRHVIHFKILNCRILGEAGDFPYISFYLLNFVQYSLASALTV